jgi:hypothetical protein
MMTARVRGDCPRDGPIGFKDLALTDQIDDEDLESGMLDDSRVAPW